LLDIFRTRLTISSQLGTIGLDNEVNRQAIDGLGAAGVDLSPG
jgi:hypothetical protein